MACPLAPDSRFLLCVPPTTPLRYGLYTENLCSLLLVTVFIIAEEPKQDSS